MGDKPIVRKSKRELKLMRRAGLVVWKAHQQMSQVIKPGATTGQIDAAAARVFAEHNAIPLFLDYPGEVPFPAVTCISVNEEVVHGIPGPRVLQEGDIVSVDTGCQVGGWCGDAARTYPVGEISAESAKLLEVTEGSLYLAIDLMGTKSYWSEVSREMAKFVHDHGFHVVKSFVGHGIGREMHEEPQVPNYAADDLKAEDDFRLAPGLVLAVEPMVNVGTEEVEQLDDHWTQITADGSFSAHFEHTIAITSDGPRVLTQAPGPEEEI